MNETDFIRSAILGGTIPRNGFFPPQNFEKAFITVAKALFSSDLDELNFIPINTVNKRTYITHVNQYYLVFDYCLLEDMIILDSILSAPESENILNAFFYKTLSEECYISHKLDAALTLAKEYAKQSDYLLNIFKENDFSNSMPKKLFTQQFFLILHELSHYFHHSNDLNTSSAKGFSLDKQTYNILMDETLKASSKFENTEFSRNPIPAAECACDADASLESLYISSTEVIGLPPIEGATAIFTCILNQLALKVIREMVNSTHSRKQKPNDFLNDWLFRLIHIRKMLFYYLYVSCSEEIANEFQKSADNYFDDWLEKIIHPIYHLLSDQIPIMAMAEVKTYDKETQKRDVEILQSIYNA